MEIKHRLRECKVEGGLSLSALVLRGSGRGDRETSSMWGLYSQYVPPLPPLPWQDQDDLFFSLCIFDVYMDGIVVDECH